MDEDSAREMIAQIGQWLADGAPGAQSDDVEESLAADIAREFSSQLLNDAEAEGVYGCSLCNS